MPIYLGTTEITSVKLGTTALDTINAPSLSGDGHTNVAPSTVTAPADGRANASTTPIVSSKGASKR